MIRAVKARVTGGRAASWAAAEEVKDERREEKVEELSMTPLEPSSSSFAPLFFDCRDALESSLSGDTSEEDQGLPRRWMRREQ